MAGRTRPADLLAEQLLATDDPVRAELGDPGFTVDDDTLVAAEKFRVIADEHTDLPALLVPSPHLTVR